MAPKSSDKASSSSKDAPRSPSPAPSEPLGPKESRAELRKDVNAIIINSACQDCIEKNVRCEEQEEDGKPCSACKQEDRNCNAHGLIPYLDMSLWPCAAAVVYITDYRRAARHRHFETPVSPTVMADCFEHLSDSIIMYKEWGWLPDWCPNLEVPESDEAVDADDIKDIPASMVKRVLEWDEWEGLCPAPHLVPALHFRDNWLERMLPKPKAKAKSKNKRKRS